MKEVKFTWLVLLGAGLVLTSARTMACEPIQIRSVDPAQSREYFGNGFAISRNEVITADHVIAPQATQIELRIHGRSLHASIEQRSYNYDLALLKVSGAQTLPKACAIVPNLAGTMRRVQIAGVHMGERHKTTISGLVTNARSERLMVPGVLSALEIAGAGVSHSLSGAPVITREGVIGLISEMVPNADIALAIPAPVLEHFVSEVHADALRALPYQYDYEDRSILFSGLKIKDSYLGPLLKTSPDVAGGDPHGAKIDVAGGDPHGGFYTHKIIAIPVAGERPTNSAVRAGVVNARQLAAQQPRILKTLGEHHDWTGLTIVIQSIDGIPTPNFITFMRVLANCSECEIDRFMVETKDPAAISDHFVRASGYAEELARDLKRQPPSVQRAVLIQNIDRYAGDILTLRYDLKMLHSYNLNLARQMFAAWSIIESELDAMPIGGDRELSDLGKVRAFNAVLKVQLASRGLM